MTVVMWLRELIALSQTVEVASNHVTSLVRTSWDLLRLLRPLQKYINSTSSDLRLSSKIQM
jgi:hypothetical protein